MNRVVITGLGVISPLGNSIKEFWNNIINGKSGADEITKFDISNFKTKFACEVKGFNPDTVLDRKELRTSDLFTQYAIAASDEAIKSANLDFASYSVEERADFGVIWASGNGGISTLENELETFFKSDGIPRFSPFLVPKMIIDIAAGIISIRNKLHGPNYATVSACASSNTAIINAFDTIRLGKAKIMIAGGSEAAITKTAIGGFNSAQALSKRNDSPQTASRPFDISRDGFVMGEGAGALILEELNHALSRDAIIFGEIIGGGMAADAYHITGTHPDGLGAILSMNKALLDANINSSQIDYVNMHATSTEIGDISELLAVKSVFKNEYVKVTAPKSMLGHLLGAAGAVESIISVLSIYNNIIPATINTIDIDSDLSKGVDIVLQRSQKVKVDYVLNNTFGFGGHTASTIFKKYEK